MRYTVRVSRVEILGRIWQPGFVCGQSLDLSDYDVENARDEDGEITRDSLALWIDRHTGDFSEIIDFSASIEDGDETIEIPWQDEDNEGSYSDAMYPNYDEEEVSA